MRVCRSCGRRRPSAHAAWCRIRRSSATGREPVRPAVRRGAACVVVLGLLGRLAGELGGDLLGGGLGGGLRRRRPRRRATPVARQQVVVLVDVRLERERGAAGEGGDELVGRARTPRPRSRASRSASTASGSVAARAERSLGALDGRVRDERAQQPDRADGVVVGRDDEVELVGVDVRVARADDRDLELVGLGHGDPLAMRVDDEDGAGQALHLAHAAERALELGHLLGQLRGFLLGHPLEVAGLLARLELLEQADPLLDRDEVGEHAAEPALVDVRHGRRGSPPGRSAPGPASWSRRTGPARRGRRSRGRPRGRRPGAGRSGRGR